MRTHRPLYSDIVHRNPPGPRVWIIQSLVMMGESINPRPLQDISSKIPCQLAAENRVTFSLWISGLQIFLLKNFTEEYECGLSGLKEVGVPPPPPPHRHSHPPPVYFLDSRNLKPQKCRAQPLFDIWRTWRELDKRNKLKIQEITSALFYRSEARG